MTKRIIIGICGASGSVYGIRLLKALTAHSIEIYLTVSTAARFVISQELGYEGETVSGLVGSYGGQTSHAATIHEFSPDDLSAPFSSGSFQHDGMVIVPCSMNTLAAVASGLTGNLMQRAADVSLKEKRPLILVPRETPLNRIHLFNMGRAADAGATIMPAAPSFYSRPQTVDEVVDTVVSRILDHLGITDNGFPRWDGIRG